MHRKSQSCIFSYKARSASSGRGDFMYCCSRYSFPKAQFDTHNVWKGCSKQIHIKLDASRSQNQSVKLGHTAIIGLRQIQNWHYFAMATFWTRLVQFQHFFGHKVRLRWGFGEASVRLQDVPSDVPRCAQIGWERSPPAAVALRSRQVPHPPATAASWALTTDERRAPQSRLKGTRHHKASQGITRVSKGHKETIRGSKTRSIVEIEDKLRC